MAAVASLFSDEMSHLDSGWLFFFFPRCLIGNPSVKWAQTWSIKKRLVFFLFFISLLLFLNQLSSRISVVTHRKHLLADVAKINWQWKLPKQATQRQKTRSTTRHFFKIKMVSMRQRLPRPPAANGDKAGPPAQQCSGLESTRGLEGCGFDSEPGFTKDYKYASLLGPQYLGWDSNKFLLEQLEKTKLIRTCKSPTEERLMIIQLHSVIEL